MHDSQPTPTGAKVPRPVPVEWQNSSTCLLLFLVVIAVYWPAVHCGFVDFDDPVYVQENQHVLTGLTWENVQWAFTSVYMGFWIPLTWLSYMLDAAAWGTAPGGFHFTNIVLHAANTSLVFVLFRRMTRQFWPCAFLALLFALHPLRVESVAWVTERKDVLSAFFGLFALIGYVEYSNNPRPVRRIWYAASLFAFACGLMGKPMVVTLPFVMVLLDFWPLERVASRSPSLFARLFSEKLPFFALSAISAFITFSAHSHAKGVATLASLGLAHRTANALTAYLGYVQKTFWPFDLAILYPLEDQVPALRVILAVCVLLSITGATLYYARRFPFLIVGWLWFLGMLVPVSGLVQAGMQSMADRFTYLPSLGILLMIVWGLAAFAPRFAVPRGALAVIALLIVAACAARTVNQLHYWQDTAQVFVHAATVTKDNYVAHLNAAAVLATNGHSDEAAFHYKQALQINPKSAETLNNLGFGLAQKGQFNQAVALYNRALEFRPDMIELRLNLAAALNALGSNSAAADQYREVLRHKPDTAAAHNDLGVMLQNQGKVSDAMAEFQTAMRLKSDYPSPFNNLGYALMLQERFSEAVTNFAEAVRLKPDFIKARLNLAAALARLDRAPEAMDQYRKVLAYDASNAEAHDELAVALIGENRLPEALSHLEIAVRSQPANPDIHYNYGNALLAVTNLPSAEGQFREVLRLSPQDAGACYKLGLIREQQGRADEAIAFWKRALEFRPDYTEARDKLKSAAVGKTP